MMAASSRTVRFRAVRRAFTSCPLTRRTRLPYSHYRGSQTISCPPSCSCVTKLRSLSAKITVGTGYRLRGYRKKSCNLTYRGCGGQTGYLPSLSSPLTMLQMGQNGSSSGGVAQPRIRRHRGATRPSVGPDMGSLDVRPRRPDWQDQAACRGAGWKPFFTEDIEHAPKDKESALEGVRFCAVCPVRNQCLQYALNHEPDVGIWGGMTGLERQEERARRLAHKVFVSTGLTVPRKKPPSSRRQAVPRR
jgi:WhiB family redox-sensing transcriptional regulator